MQSWEVCSARLNGNSIETSVDKMHSHHHFHKGSLQIKKVSSDVKPPVSHAAVLTVIFVLIFFSFFFFVYEMSESHDYNFPEPKGMYASLFYLTNMVK